MVAELGSRHAGGGLLIGVQSRRRSDVAAHGLVRGVRPDAELGSADLRAALPDFPPPSAREPLRLSEVHNREPGAYTAQEKREGLHLGPEARSKRSASSAFENVIAQRTDYICALQTRGDCSFLFLCKVQEAIITEEFLNFSGREEGKNVCEFLRLIHQHRHDLG